MYELARELNIDSKQVLAALAAKLVGDTPLDVAAALATGARAVGVATGTFPADIAAAGAHVALPDLTGTPLLVAAVTGTG